MVPTSNHFVRFNDKLLQIIRFYPDDRVRNVDEIKKWLKADIAIRKDGITYFCEEIQEAEIVPGQVVKKTRRSRKKIK
jgi:hypothetical protein